MIYENIVFVHDGMNDRESAPRCVLLSPGNMYSSLYSPGSRTRTRQERMTYAVHAKTDESVQEWHICENGLLNQAKRSNPN